MIGCGAIAETYHLPALERHAGRLEHIVLVDPDLRRAQALASTLSGVDTRTAASHEHVWDDIDAAIIATPPRLHADIAMPLLARGVHVFCEKPLAESASDAAAMIERAAQSGAWLCVNQTRRSYPALKRVKDLLTSGIIGECVAIEHREGFRFAWPSVSGWHFARGNSARGVLLDQGAHVLDTICWWLGDKPRRRVVPHRFVRRSRGRRPYRPSARDVRDHDHAQLAVDTCPIRTGSSGLAA